ncbi:MAG: putative transporter [Myxococcota bacterium]|jgi:putative transport protein|nr:putative transporter [Myxococcota bacterium]
MEWLTNLFVGGSVAHSVLVLSLVISLGLAVGNIRIAGVSLGVGGVLFSGLAFGHLGLGLHTELLEFVREFGLILFVYAIGLQVGPGFFASLRSQGLMLNLMAVVIVLSGTGIAVLIALFAGVDLPTAVGMLCGGVTSTPSLGAAQQAVADVALAPEGAAQMIGLGYAVAYPFGIVGIILTMALLRRLFRIDPAKEAEQFTLLQNKTHKPLQSLDFDITNANLDGLTVDEIAELSGPGIVITRVFRNSAQTLASHDTVVRLGDTIHAVGTHKQLERLRVIVGKKSELELRSLPSPIAVRRVVATQKAVIGKSLEELDLDDQFGVVITRVVRSGVEFSPTASQRLHFGDRIVIVGMEQAIERAARHVGNSVSDLDKPHIVPVFVGIALGVIVGSIPFAIPGIPAPVKLGLAGGPLLVAIALGRVGKLGPLISYLPNPAGILLRELGISLFLACVGLRSGEKFFEIVATGSGLKWMGLAALITFLPVFCVGLYARAIKKLNFVSLCGVLAGAMTDPPALAYASSLVKNDSPSIAYATVYPLTMLLRVVLAQIVVIALMSG